MAGQVCGVVVCDVRVERVLIREDRAYSANLSACETILGRDARGFDLNSQMPILRETLARH